jgi:cbb3-type cytochrome oxidase subunit 3
MALYYWKLYIKWLNRVRDEREQTNVYGIQRKYDYESLQNTMNQQIARKQRIIAISIVLLLCVVTWFMYRTSQRNKREAEANANLFHFMEQNKALVESNIAHEKKVLDTTQQLSDLLYARLKAMQKLDYCLKTPKDKIALKDLEKEVFGTGDHWDAIREVLVALYPGLLETLKLKYPEMDEMELRVCMLSRLKLSRLAESTLLGISVSVLDKTRTKVHKMIGQDNKQ